MNLPDAQSREPIAEIEAALCSLAPLLGDSTRLPAAADLLRRARLREREVAAGRLARWHGWLRGLSFGLVALAAAAAVQAIEPHWGSWLLKPLLERPPRPGGGDAAVLAGAVLAVSVSIVWVSQQFVDE